jgi:hypothetical protein
LFDRAVLLGLRDAIGENWTFLISGLYSPHEKSAYASADVTRKLTDEWLARVFIQLLYGPPQSLLGILSHNDRVGLQLTRSF